MEQKPSTHTQPTSGEETPMEKGNQPKADAPAKEKKAPLVKRIWVASGLNPLILIMMFKGAIAPTIALAIYQASDIAKIYTTLGYLVAVMSILAMPILPRSKFIQNLFLNLIGICIGSAIAMLTVYCSVQARKHTTPKVPLVVDGKPVPPSRYNSSSSAVCAIFLFANIYFVNTLRASRPQLQLAVIIYSILAMVSSTYAPSFPTMPIATAFVKRLIEAFTLAMAIATGVNLLIFPTTCRMIFLKQSAGMLGILQKALQAQKVYVQSLEDSDMFLNTAGDEPTEADEPAAGVEEESPQKHDRKLGGGKKPKPKSKESAQAAAMKATLSAMAELQGKMYADITFAKRELAYGKLDAHAIETINNHFRSIMLPLYGMSSITDIFSRVAEKRGWTKGDHGNGKLSPEEQSEEDVRRDSIKQWNEVMKKLHEPFESMTGLMCEGLQHISFALEFSKPPKSTADVEANAGVTRPGDSEFRQHLKKQIDALYAQRQVALDVFLKKMGINGDGQYAAKSAGFSTLEGEKLEEHKISQRKLYMVLYMEYLMWSTGRAILRFVEYADDLVKDGTMKKKRIIHPGGKRLQKWFTGLLNKEDMSSTEQNPDSAESGSAGVYSGASFQTKLDPEHLPPTNAWQRFSNGFRNIAGVLRSPESAFGFRVACATLSIGIIGFLEKTQVFFQNQRLVWAMIMIAIGMTVTAGAGIFGFMGRIVGTFLAMVTSIAIWYVVNGHPAGVLVAFFVFTFIEFYVFIKYPKMMVITLLSIVTQVLIIGYELQVHKVGVLVATSNGQPFYHVYLLAPYRLATVLAGMAVAFFWTFFPYPLTERSQLRKDLGSALYLLANFYSVVHSSVTMRVRGTEGDLNDKESPGHKLDKARRDIWDKEMALVGSLHQHSAFTVWEPTFGGKFPKQTYDTMIEKVSSLLNYLSLLAYASRTFSTREDEFPASEKLPAPTKDVEDDRDATDDNVNVKSWRTDFTRLMVNINPTSQALTSTLALLAGAVAQGSPLPPYLKVPDPYMLSARLEALDEGILGVEHVLEPGYAAFAVMQIASSLVRDDLSELIELVKLLVGEVDFTFHIHDSASSTGNLSSSETLLGKGKRD